ncbi:hypothetical protein [Nocardioides sp. WS12]|uniref:hypothetical protein n=1 Tax=Nocardioides sp. WS12 TaxID=2486272 RepID=UPI0015FA7A99|nr:hypothetical protein [Nocardioides sp. WS12]
MTETGAIGIQFSWWMLFAAFGSVSVGLLYTMLAVRQSAGGGLRTVAHAVLGKLDCLLITVVVDALGGLILGVVAAFLSLSEPRFFVSFVNDRNLLGWFIFGLAGPVLADRMFTGSMFQSRFTGWLSEAQVSDQSGSPTGAVDDLTARSWRLRSEALMQIQMRCWVIVQRRMLREANRLRELADRGLADRLPDLVQLPRLCRQLPHRGFVVPQTVTDAAARVSTAETDEMRFELVAALVEELLLAQVWYPLYVLFGETHDAEYA